MSIALCVITRLLYFDEAFLLIEALTSLSGFFLLLIVLFYPSSRFNFFIISPLVILLGTSLGLLNTYLTVNFFQDVEWINIIIDNNISTDNLVDGQAYTNGFCLVLTLLGYKLQRVGLVDSIFLKAEIALDKDSTTAVFVTVVFICQLYLLLTNEIVFGGVTADKLGKASHPLQALTPVFGVLPIWSAYKLKKYLSNKSNPYSFLLPLSIAFVNLYYPFLLGRRMLFFYIILFLSGYYYKETFKLKLVSYNTFLIISAILITIQLSNLYNKFRMIKGYEFIQQNGIRIAFNDLSNEQSADFTRNNLANVSIRSSYNTMTFAYFISLTNKLNKPLYGTSFLNQFLVTTPGEFFVKKSTILTKERLYMDVFSITLNDISDTVYLEALVDFGLAGIIVYPFLLFIIIFPVYSFVAKPANALFTGSASYLMALSMVETDCNVFMTMIRILIVVFICSHIVKLFLNK